MRVRASMLLSQVLDVTAMLLHQLLLMYNITPPPFVLLSSPFLSDLMVVKFGSSTALSGTVS